MEWVEKIFSWRRKNRQEGVSSQTTSVGGGGGGALQGDEEGPNEEKGLDEEAFHGSDDTKEDVISDDDDDDDDVTDKRKEEEDDADSAHISEMEDDAVVVSDDDNIDESRIVDAKTAPTGGAFQEEEGPDEEDSQGRDLKADGEQEIIRVVSEDDNDKKDERPIQQEVRSIDDSRDELSDLGSNENHGESQENVPHDFGYGPLKISWTWSFPDVVHRLHNQSIWKTSEYVNGTKNWSERFLKRFGEGFAEWEHSTALYAVLYHFSLHYDGEIKEIYATSYWFIVLIITLFLVSMLLWRRKKRSKSPNRRSISEPRMGGMEILRTTRERSSTFDFFGVSMRDRRHSIDSVDGFRDRSDSGPTEIRRKRLGSMDLYGTRKESTKSIFSEANPANRHSTSQDIMSDDFISSHMEDEEGYLYDEFGLVTLSVHVEYYGPKITTLKYSTWTPPTSWVEASRRIIPQDIMLKLQRDLILDVKKACIEVREPKSSGKWGFSLPVQNISMHVTPPVEGGVISLYVKGSSKEDWMEHTFELASDAAQFQLDLLGYQVLGRTLFHMFEALSLVHLGSLAYDGQEFVLHDKKIEESETEENPNEGREAGHGCVAWDDALRALSSIPTIRIALERLWIKHRRSEQFGEGKKGNANSSKEESSKDGLLVESYLNKRLLLGPVDFFRLFVPALPETALPQSESSRARMEQLLSWRKRAARAAVLIRAYTMSHRVVNRGWKLSYPVHDNPEVKLTKRIAFDDNEDNHRRDINAKNEYYEASVSRDVLCHVRPFDYFRQNTIKDKFSKRRLVLSPYQAYSLVESHMFKIPQDDPDDNRLVPSRDPVATFPSLKTLISQNPDLDFFVASFYSKNSVTVLCFVRTLPKGIDPQFDNVVSQFFRSLIVVCFKKTLLKNFFLADGPFYLWRNRITRKESPFDAPARP